MKRKISKDRNEYRLFSLKKLNENQAFFWLVLLFIAAVMFIFNTYTSFTADDYSYMNSFAGTGRIESILDIFPSMYAHAFSMNGRLVPHFFVQLFLLFPPYVFDIINTFIFLFLNLILYKYIFGNNKINVLGMTGIFAAVWYFVPAFGQTMLWLDGSCNYLWGITFAFWYLYPYIRSMRDGEDVLKKPAPKYLFAAAGLLLGNWLETVSFGTIIISATALIIYKAVQKGKIPLYMISGIGFMCAGFLAMMLAPGTLKNKVASEGLSGYAENFLEAMDMYMAHLSWLVIAFIVLLTCTVIFGYKKNIEVSCLFFFASLITNFMHIVAAYYPERNMLAPTLFLLIASGVLLENFQTDRFAAAVVSTCWILILFSGVQFFHGGYDIYSTYVQHRQRDALAAEQKKNGIEELKLPCITVATKYSAQYGLADLDIEEDSVYSFNIAVAKYYEVDSVTGIEQE